MMKKLFCVLIALACICSINIPAFADIDQQYDTTVYEMGDVNTDGEVNTTDCLEMLNLMLKKRSAVLNYEYADLNGDIEFNTKDLLLLKKHLASIEISISTEKFQAQDKDVTHELDDLGINNGITWNNNNTSRIVSRNPYDMITYGDRVLVSGGNYQDNTGPVTIRYYRRDSDKASYAGQLDSEQINRFYIYNNMLHCTSIDSKYWGAASVYTLKGERVTFQTQQNVLKENIHCYDMSLFNGTYFFCGSTIHYDSNYKNYSGEDLEMSKAVVYKFTGEDLFSCTSNDFTEVELVNQYGEVLDYELDLSSAQRTDSATGEKITYYYENRGVPRIYDMFEWNGNLYAMYYDQYISNYASNYDYNGFYKYDEEKGQFIYDSAMSIDGIVEMFDASQDKGKIHHDFSWGDDYYFIANGLYSTSDFVSYSRVTISGYEDYIVRDVIFRAGKVYLLCARQRANGSYLNYVLETDDFENYRAILHFDAASYARSFEFCNGAFFFGLGADVINNTCNTECGRIYRYIYYK